MADDLDDFLKQAALRRQQRQQQKGNRAPVAQPVQQPAPPPPPTPRLQQQDPIASARVTDSKPYEASVGNLSSSLPSELNTTLRRSDDRFESPVQQDTQRDISSLRQSEKKASKKKQPKQERQERQLVETPATSAKVSSLSLIAQLRDPQSLRMAIIAHEILKRPWE
jgi:hypothetical protein